VSTLLSTGKSQNKEWNDLMRKKLFFESGFERNAKVGGGLGEGVGGGKALQASKGRV